MLSKHISHLFIRDPLVIFSETINQDDKSSSDHFEVGFTIDNLGRGLKRNLETLEHPIDELANAALQATAA